MPDPWSKDAFSHVAFEFLRDLLLPLTEFSRWPSLPELQSLWFGSGEATFTLVPQPPKRRRGKQRGEVRCRDMLYDCRVHAGAIPTRASNWHDLFNVAMFRSFPLSKRRLHERLCTILQNELPGEFHRLPGRRTREQDYLALLDEGGVLLVVEPSKGEALSVVLESDEPCPLSAFQSSTVVEVVLFGHAHLEAIARYALGGPAPWALRAMPVVLETPHRSAGSVSRSALDETLCAHLSAVDFQPFSRKPRGVTLGMLFGSGSGHPQATLAATLSTEPALGREIS